MKGLNGKPKSIAALAVFLLLTISVSFLALPNASAHSPAWTYRFYARVHVAPNPVGVGQNVIIVASVNWALPGALYINDVRPQNVTILITKPDGHQDKFNFASAPDSGGSAFVNYTPDQTGTYTVQAIYGDTIYRWNSTNTPSLAPINNQFYGDIWLGSTATNTLIVQQEPVGNTQVWPLPTEYWTRPIPQDNYQWQMVSSNWLAGSSAGGASISLGVAPGTRWQQYGSAPRTAHVMWTRPIEFGGLVGGSEIPGQSFYSGMSYQTRFNDPIVISGVLYYRQPLGHAGSGGGYVAANLRTGEEIWRRNDIDPSKGQLIEFDSGNQHGTMGATLWQVQGSNWYGYDAFTGKNVYNFTNVPNGYEVYDTTKRDVVPSATIEEGAVYTASLAGDITRYVVNYNTTTNTGTLGMWSSVSALTNNSTSLDATTANGHVINASNYFAWSVPLPNLKGAATPTIIGVIPNDILVGTSSSVTLTYLPRTTHDNPWTMWAISLKPETRGQLIWKKDYPAAPGNITRMLTMVPVDSVNRVWTMTDFDTMHHSAYSIDTGDLVWYTYDINDQTKMNSDFRPIQWYSAREGIAAYGILYIPGYGGEVFAYSTKNGTLLWKFNDTDTTKYTTGQPWGLQPLHIGAMADGIIYLFAGEHSPITPLYTGYRMFALNAFTGEKIFEFFDWSSSGLGTSIPPLAVADGFMTFYNNYDGQIYTLGKGPSATTVFASPKSSVAGSSVLIEGRVVDISAGTNQDEQAARFPNGVPAVSDASMSAWMEYVYQKKPKPADATGVLVSISVRDANNNTRNIGTTSTDANGDFSFAWIPDIAGKYTVYASFAGSDSYWPSNAGTAFTVDEAQPATSESAPAGPSIADQYFVPAVIGIIAAIVVVGLGVVLALKKRP